MLATVKVKLKSMGPYSQSRQIPERPAGDERSHEQYDRDCVWLKAHFMPDGEELCIPGQAFKMALDTAAKRLSLKHPNGGKSLLTKNFLSGIMLFQPLALGLNRTSPGVRTDSLAQNTDGVRGSGKRGIRTFPVIDDWRGTLTFTVTDDVISESAFVTALEYAGQSIGIGRWRAENGGLYGRFLIDGSPEWTYQVERASKLGAAA